MNKLIKIVLLILFSLIIVMLDDFYMIGTFYFYSLLGFLIFDVIKQKKIILIHIWCLGFIYIILSEVFLIFGETSNLYALNALKYLIIANNFLLIGYYSNTNIKNNIIKTKKFTYNAKKGGAFLLIASILFYVAMTWQEAIRSFAMGREVDTDGESFVIGSVVNAMGFLLPSVTLFYFYHIKKKSLLIPFLFSTPVFLILFMSGSRFPLLFSFLGFFITYQNLNTAKISVKKIFLMSSAVIILLSASLAMKEFRSGIKLNNNYIESDSNYKDFPTYVSQYLSNEGVIDMTSLMMRHFESHEHLYGKSSSFLLYFWVPRELWNDKPTMLGHWFVREYRSGFVSGHSSSFGFTGDLFADFGYFSIILIFLIGRLLRNAENFRAKSLASKNYNVIIGAMLFPYVFFFVRSPITATMTFLGILFFFYLFKRVIFSEVVINKKNSFGNKN
ncbi:O-antigen polymerase [uncultured Flavobacterium sp.]|uniref:O-antigen polymerase n=1 Tax=uncultured Flavobacterium sp. TaxID=165435 RepID=UPI0030C7E1EA